MIVLVPRHPLASHPSRTIEDLHPEHAPRGEPRRARRIVHTKLTSGNALGPRLPLVWSHRTSPPASRPSRRYDVHGSPCDWSPTIHLRAGCVKRGAGDSSMRTLTESMPPRWHYKARVSAATGSRTRGLRDPPRGAPATAARGRLYSIQSHYFARRVSPLAALNCWTHNDFRLGLRFLSPFRPPL